jgi:hypothetical protein
MAVLISELITLLDRYTGDDTTDRISEQERFSALSEAGTWLNEELGNDHGLLSYNLDFYDTVNYYRVTDTLSHLFTSGDLRLGDNRAFKNATHKDARELAVEISNNSRQFAWGIQRNDSETYIAITNPYTEQAVVIGTFDSSVADGGVWEEDSTDSDATNIKFDTYNKTKGNASLSFDIDVSQSVNNRATIRNTSLRGVPMEQFENVGSFLIDVYFPDITDITSITLFWGDDTSNYWTATATTDLHGNSFVAGDNTVKIDWNGATKIGTPSLFSRYFRIDVNYEATQIDMNGVRLDNFRIARPTKLVFYYNSWIVGYDTAGEAIPLFSAITDAPYYSGVFDQYRYAHAHKAASILLHSPLRRHDDARVEETEAVVSLRRYRKLVPKTQSPETRNFKVAGINFRKRKAS